MRVELPVISFICATLLAVFILVRRIRENIANLAIVSWLIGCNVIHGINTILWAGNVNIHIPVWCDIVTKLLLGAILAVPAGCLCISRHLELISSTRRIPCDAHSKRNGYLIDISLCYILPVIYLSLHSIGQDHRFDLVKDFGCSASVHPSIPALIIIWLPPLIVCSISLVFSALAVYNSYRLSSRFSSHLSSRSPLSSSTFVRRLVMSILSTGVLTVTVLFSIFSPSLKPWVSFSSVHAHFYDINVVRSRDEINSVQIWWWSIPVVSVIYILLSFSVGARTRDAVQRFRERISRRPVRPSLLVLHTRNKCGSGTASQSQPFTTPQPRPQEAELKSGWDDMLEAPKRTRTRSKPNSTPFIPLHPESPCPSPIQSSSCKEDDAFMESTLIYLGSPTAQTLGLPTSLTTSSLVCTSPRTALHNTLPCKPVPAHTPVDSLRELNLTPISRYIPEDAVSTTSSIWDAPWPQPPSSVDSSHYSSRSVSNSSTLSHDTFGRPSCPPTTPPNLQMRTFHEPSTPPFSNSKQVGKAPGINNLRGWSRAGLDHDHDYLPGEVIYMTAVPVAV